MRFLLVVGLLFTSIQVQAQTFKWESSVTGVRASSYGSKVDVSADNSIGFGLDPATASTITTPNTMAIMGGNVGVGTVSPATELDVNGELRLGNSSSTCAAGIEGAIRYNSTNKTIELCDGTGWSEINLSCDITPDGFDITDVGSVATGSLQTSPIVQITGVTCSITVSISGTGSPEYRTCSDATCTTEIQTWTSVNGSVANNQYLQLRLTASPDSFSTRTATINVGGAVDNWTVTTVNDGSYKRVFFVQLFNSSADGAFGGVAGADALCQSEADAASLGGTFFAWIATDSTDDPESRFTQAAVPYKNMDGVQIANNWTDLVDGGALASAIDMRADGTEGGNSDSVWTNVNEDGTAFSNTDNCNGWFSNGSGYVSEVGRAFNATTWTDRSSQDTCDQTNTIYCFEQ